MKEKLPRLREFIENLPISFSFLAPFLYLIFFLSALLYIALWPFLYVYGLLRCCEVWIDWKKQGKDILLIELDDTESQDFVSALRQLTGRRVVSLNWSKRKDWDRLSLPVQLFEVFGPHGMPEQFTAYSLPAIIVFRQFRRPLLFTLGKRSKDPDQKLEQLRSALELN